MGGGQGATTKTMRAAWGGTEFLHLSATVPPPRPVPPENMTLGHSFQWKYFPSPADGTKAQISQLTDYPYSHRTTSYAAGTACEVQWLPRHHSHVTFAEMPTQYKVINALTNLPVLGAPTCGIAHSASILQNDMSAVVVDHFMVPAHETSHPSV